MYETFLIYGGPIIAFIAVIIIAIMKHSPYKTQAIPHTRTVAPSEAEKAALNFKRVAVEERAEAASEGEIALDLKAQKTSDEKSSLDKISEETNEKLKSPGYGHVDPDSPNDLVSDWIGGIGPRE